MNPLAYNAALLIGWVMVTGGAVFAFGAGIGLIVGGATLVALTLMTARLAA